MLKAVPAKLILLVLHKNRINWNDFYCTEISIITYIYVKLFETAEMGLLF